MRERVAERHKQPDKKNTLGYPCIYDLSVILGGKSLLGLTIKSYRKDVAVMSNYI